jgi:hypothetical protein
MSVTTVISVCLYRELESTVEELRGNVINRKTRVNMSDVENMALILSKSRSVSHSLKSYIVWSLDYKGGTRSA